MLPHCAGVIYRRSQGARGDHLLLITAYRLPEEADSSCKKPSAADCVVRHLHEGVLCKWRRWFAAYPRVLFNQHLWLQRRAPAQQKQPASARARGGAGQPGKDAKLRRRRSSSTRAARRDAARLRDDQQQPQQQQQKQRRRQLQGGGGFAASFSKAGAPAKNIVVTLQNDLYRPVVRLLRRPRRTPAGCVIPVCALTHGVLFGASLCTCGSTMPQLWSALSHLNGDMAGTDCVRVA